jgi:nucleotide-binding universal stress UspA family protein
MTRTIVVPLDRSTVAESALPFAISLANQTGGRLALLAVIDLPFEFAAWLDASTVIDARIDVEDAYGDYLEALALEIEDVPVEAVVRSGNAAAEIQHFVEALEDPVVVMASHGRSGVRRMLIGSVTQQVVHRVKTPVIVVPARVPEDRTAEPKLDKLLFPLDGSEFAEYALEAGLALMDDYKPEIHLLRVVEVVSWYGGPYSGMDYYGLDPYIDVSRDAADAYLTRIATDLHDRGYTVTTEVRVGLVADQIEAVAEGGGVDMVVMATHGRAGVGRLIFGSVAERALRQSPTPLMLVHPGPDVPDYPADLAESLVTVQA